MCSWCGSDSAVWAAATGFGHVHSWVRYHRGYLPEFESLLPYVVLAIRLDEGPSIIGRLVSCPSTPVIGQRVSAVIERWSDGFCSLAFELVEGAS
jgi:uncharacterized OB-fold protein